MSGWWLVPAAGLLALAITLTAARCGTRADIADGLRVGIRALSGDPNPAATPLDVPGIADLCGSHADEGDQQ